MLTCVDEREEGEEVLRHLCTSSNMRQDTPRLQFLIFALAGEPSACCTLPAVS